MGGALRLLLREKSGNTSSYEVWTNPFPYFVHHPDFFKDSEAHFNEYFGREEKVSDTTPSEYGIVVVDRLKKSLYSANGYSSPGRISCYSVKAALSDFCENKSRIHVSSDYKLDKYYQELLNEGRLIETVSGRTGRKSKIHPKTIEELYSIANDCSKSKDDIVSFNIKTDPWTFHSGMMDSTSDYKNLLSLLKGEEILSREDLLHWEEYFKLREEEEG